MIALEEIRQTLRPELLSRFNLVSSKSGHNRIIFVFSTEEAGICGSAVLREWLDKSEIAGRIIQSEAGNVVFLYLEGFDE